MTLPPSRTTRVATTCCFAARAARSVARSAVVRRRAGAIVDLLQDGLARPRLVVFVGREGGPVPPRRDQLAGAQPVGGEGARRAEVRDLARRVARAADLHGHALGRSVGGLQTPPRLRHGQRELASAVALDLEPRVPRDVREIGDAIEDGSASFQPEPMPVGAHGAGAGERQARPSRWARVDRARRARGQPHHAQPGEGPSREGGRHEHGIDFRRRRFPRADAAAEPQPRASIASTSCG